MRMRMKTGNEWMEGDIRITWNLKYWAKSRWYNFKTASVMWTIRGSLKRPLGSPYT